MVVVRSLLLILSFKSSLSSLIGTCRPTCLLAPTPSRPCTPRLPAGSPLSSLSLLTTSRSTKSYILWQDYIGHWQLITQSLIVDSYQNQMLSQIYLCRCFPPLSFILWKYKRQRVFPACQLLFRGWRFCWGEECWAFFGQSPLFNFFKKTFVLSITHITPPGAQQVQCDPSGTPRATIPAAARTSAGAAGAWPPDSAQSKVSQIFSFYCHVSLSFTEKKLLLLRPPAPTYPSAASSGRRNSISVSANSNLASMSNNTSSSMVATSSSTTRRRHVSMSSAASYGTPAASRGLPFYWT